jgi:hypothetical protein
MPLRVETIAISLEIKPCQRSKFSLKDCEGIARTMSSAPSSALSISRVADNPSGKKCSNRAELLLCLVLISSTTSLFLPQIVTSFPASIRT